MPGRVAGPTPDTTLPRPGPLGPGPCSVCSRALRPRSATQKTGAASPLCTSGPQSAPEATSPFAAASAHTPHSACAHRRAHGNVSYAVGRETECVDRLRLSGPHPPSGSVNRRPPPHREGGAPEGQRVHVCAGGSARAGLCPSGPAGMMLPLQPSSPRIPPGLPFSAGTATPSQPPHLSFPVPCVPFLLGALRAPVSKTLHGQGCGKSPGLCQRPGSEFSVCR